MTAEDEASFWVLSLPSREAILVSYLLTPCPLLEPHTVGQDILDTPEEEERRNETPSEPETSLQCYEPHRNPTWKQ